MALYISRQQLLACTLGYAGYISTLVGANDDDVIIFEVNLRRLIPNNILITFNILNEVHFMETNQYEKKNQNLICLLIIKLKN
jgi:hypothetical protein